MIRYPYLIVINGGKRDLRPFRKLRRPADKRIVLADGTIQYLRPSFGGDVA